MAPLNQAAMADAVVSIFMAGSFLFMYFCNKQPRLYKKKWVLAGCVLWVGLGGYQFYETNQKVKNNRIPTVKETTIEFQNTAILAEKEIVFTSKDGFEIIIPKGFYYNPNRNGSVTLFASKQAPDNTQFGISIMKMESTESTQSSAEGIIESFKRKSQSVEHEILNINSATQVNFKLRQNDGFSQGIVLFKKNQGYLYIIFVTAKKFTDNMNFEGELQSIVNTFKIL